jgi:hypothetical protein
MLLFTAVATLQPPQACPGLGAARHRQRWAAARQQARRADAGVTQGHGASPVR